jgi:hypothetical protein
MADREIRPVAVSSDTFKQLFPLYAAAALQGLIAREGSADIHGLTKKATEIGYSMLQSHNEMVHELRQKETQPRNFETQ